VKDRRKQHAEYRKHRRESQKKWLQNHPDYWSEYRASHPEYEDQNREKQRERDRREPPLPPGLQRSLKLTHLCSRKLSHLMRTHL